MKVIILGMVLWLVATGYHADVQNDWDASLHKALNGTSMLRICSDRGCSGNPDGDNESLEIHDAGELSEFIAHISLDPEESGILSACLGDQLLDFFRGGKVIASLELIGDRILRWRDGEWEGDAVLSRESAEYLFNWLDERGFSGPRKKYEKSLRSEREYQEAEAKWLAATPSSLKPFWKNDDNSSDFSGPIRLKQIKEMNAALSMEFPDQDERILSLLEWFGVGKGPWSGFPAYEMDAAEILFLYETNDVLHAIGEKELTPGQTGGAARFFGSWPFYNSRPDDLTLLPVSLKRKLLEHSLRSNNESNWNMARRAFEKRKANLTKR
jgi:hypothetical protein